VAIEDFRSVVRALANPEALQVFGVVAASDAGRGPQETVDSESGYKSWRVDTQALASAAV
jgi:hypothetical protein